VLLEESFISKILYIFKYLHFDFKFDFIESLDWNSYEPSDLVYQKDYFSKLKMALYFI